MNKPVLLGIDVGGTNLRLGVYRDQTLLWETRIPAHLAELFGQAASPAAATEALLELLARSIDEALAQEPAIAAVGIGFPGFIDPRSQRLSQSPNMPGLRDLDLVTPLRQHCQRPVRLENDALAAAYGEYVLAGLHPGSLIYVGLGTGVGGGLVVDGHPYPGEHGVAMEIGHIIVEAGGRLCGCGNRGCLEQYASASGVPRTYLERVPGALLPADQIAARAAQGDGAALAAFEQAGEALGQALAHILKVVDVGTVIIGGGLSLSWELFYPSLRRRLEQDLIPALRGRVQIRQSASQDRAGILGAAMLAGRLLAGPDQPASQPSVAREDS